ncbi:hypothetical protein JW868_02450 [Candidatus Woesearchaeota archaeon]|nr:hypothetical protein [Candidatus Woesearchaeota archaeon]
MKEVSFIIDGDKEGGSSIRSGSTAKRTDSAGLRDIPPALTVGKHKQPKELKKGAHTTRNVLTVVFLLLVFTLAYAYLFVINPVFVSKPDVERPDTPALPGDVSLGAGQDASGPGGSEESSQAAQEELDEVVENFEPEPEHVDYLLNEIDAYKLHEPPLGDEIPVMEVHITDDNTYFAVQVVDNQIETTEGRADNPDLIIHGSKLTILQLLNEENIMESIGSYAESGAVWVEPLKPESELAAKGYLAIYTAIV